MAALAGVIATAGCGAPPAPVTTDAPARYIERDSVRVVHWPGDERRAERTLAGALAPMPLPGIPAGEIAGSGTIVLAPTRELFDSLTHGRAPAWAAGVAIPARRLIVLPAYERRTGEDPLVTLRHELAHLALNAYLGGRVPRWFDEGYATWVSGGWDEGSGWQIRLALLRGNAPPLDSLTLAWPRAEARARLAYLLSASAVRHLATSRGDPALSAFMESWRAEGSMETAMRSVYQMNTAQFEREWRAMVRRRYGWMLAISQTAILWLVVAVLVFVLGTLRRQRNRERMEELRREEYMLPPAGGTGPGGVDPGVDAYWNPP